MANAIPGIRLLSIPIFAFFFFSNNSTLNLFAPFIYLLAILTDIADGYVARKRNEITDFGKEFDPIVDRLFILSVIIFLLLKKMIPLPGALLIIVRDILMITGYKTVSYLRERIEVDVFGKVSTFVIFASLFLIMVKLPYGIHLFWIAIGLSLISGINYTRKGYYVLAKK